MKDLKKSETAKEKEKKIEKAIKDTDMRKHITKFDLIK